MVRSCLLLLAGGLAAQHSTLLLRSDLSFLILVASSCLLFLRRGRAPAIFLSGYALLMLAGHGVIAARLDPGFAGDSMLASVRIADFPGVTGDSVTILVEPVADHRLPPQSRVTWFEPPILPRIGEVWELELRLQQPRGTFNPGVFDYESWLFREKIHATGYVVGGKRNRLLWSGTTSLLDRFRERFVARAHAAADSDDAAAVLAAIGVGARHKISRQQWDRFAASGTSHLMAISGLHIGLAALAAFVAGFALLGLLRVRNSYAGAIVLGVVCAAMYAVVSGFGVPARRAIVMLAIAALAMCRRRQVDAAATIAAAAAAVFLLDPIAALTPGFHLSFGAVGLLLWLARRKAVNRIRYRILDVPRQLLVMQVFLLFGLLPLTAVLFQRFAAVATPVNVIAVPLFSLVTVPLTLVGMVVGEWFEGPASILLGIAALTIDMLEQFITWMTDLPHAHFVLAEVSGVAWLTVLLPLLWALLPRGWPGRHIALLGVVAVISWKPAPTPEQCFDSWVLDVGQGLAVVVQTADRVLLYDTGMVWRSGGSVAERAILPFLRGRGIRHIDWLIVSHSDLDHSGGVKALTAVMPVGDILVGEPLASLHGRRCRTGQSWRAGVIRFDMLHPDASQPREGNGSSCVMRVSAGPHALLLTGDVEARSERELVRQPAALAADIVVVPHHGSMTSSTIPFVDSVHPDYAVVSAAFANRWGFPKATVVGRWEAMGAEVLNTATAGAVSFRVCADAGVVDFGRERQRRRRFWHAAT